MLRSTPLSGYQVHRPRGLVLWMALAAAAGATNAIAFIACARYVTHVTGTATTIGLDAADWEHALDYSLVFLAFVTGAGVADRVLSSGPIRRGMARALLIVGGILAGLAAAGRAGEFDAFGQGLEDPRTFVFLGALAFAMGLQNASIATATRNKVRTTHLTGPTTDFGVALARLRSPSRKARVSAARMVRLRAMTIVGFIGGAAFGAVGSKLDYLALLLPASLCFVVALILARSSMRPAAAGKELPGSQAIPTI